MSAVALITGRLHGAPTTRPTKTGGVVTFAKVRVTNGGAVEWWDITAFSEAAREPLEGLSEGDAVSAVGVVHIELFEFKGEQRIRRGLTADRLMTLKPSPRTRETQSRTGREIADAARRGGGAHGDLA